MKEEHKNMYIIIHTSLMSTSTINTGWEQFHPSPTKARPDPEGMYTHIQSTEALGEYNDYTNILSIYYVGPLTVPFTSYCRRDLTFLRMCSLERE